MMWGMNINPEDIFKTIKFDNVKNIGEVKASKKYASVITNHKVKPNTRLFLYSKNGELLLQYKPTDGNQIIQSEIIDSLEYIIIIERGIFNEKTQNSELINKISAINIITKQEIWYCFSNAANYEIAPNCMFMIPKAPEIEGNSNFEIINLENGSKIVPTYLNTLCYAAWLDMDRIIIINPQEEKNIESENIIREHQHFKDSLAVELYKLNIKLEKNIISEDDFKIQSDNIKHKMSMTKHLFKGKKRKIPINMWKRKASKIRIYNVNTNLIELEKEIILSDNISFSVYTSPIEIGNVNTDNEGGIYIFGFLLNNDGKIIDNCLIKLKKDLNVEWITEPISLMQLSIIKSENEIYYRYINNNKVIYLNNSSGEFKEMDYFRDVRNELNSDSFRFNVYKNLHIDLKNNSISFLK
jgi:hypothetical protein